MSDASNWSEQAYPEPDAPAADSLGAANTIDSSSYEPSSSFLKNARKLDPRGAAHDTTARAVQNLNGGMAVDSLGRPMHITGHGDEGIIVTGTGQASGDAAREIAIGNRGSWEPWLSQLRGRVSMLTLWACHPGAGEIGADFLYSVAQVVGCPVRGPTGFLFADYPGGMRLEPGSTWQTARPDYRPPAINAPTKWKGAPSMLKLLVDGSELQLQDEALRRAVFEPAAGVEDRAPAGIDLTELARTIAWDDPVSIPAGLAALVSGRLRLTVQTPAGETEKTFAVLNRRLLQDEQSPETYYRVPEEFTAALPLNP